MAGNTTDHLANERTFLAYLRTALAFIGFGFVVARFGVFLREFPRTGSPGAHVPSLSTPFGIVMVLVGIGVAAFGLVRFESVSKAIARGGSTALSIRSATVLVACFGIFGAVVVFELFRV